MEADATPMCSAEFTHTVIHPFQFISFFPLLEFASQQAARQSATRIPKLEAFIFYGGFLRTSAASCRKDGWLPRSGRRCGSAGRLIWWEVLAARTKRCFPFRSCGFSFVSRTKILWVIDLTSVVFKLDTCMWWCRRHCSTGLQDEKQRKWTQDVRVLKGRKSCLFCFHLIWLHELWLFWNISTFNLASPGPE